MKLFRTRDQGLASVLRYTLGSETHLKTFVEQSRSATFLFADLNNECSTIASQFFAADGGSGFAITDAKALIDEFIAVRKTLSAAISNGGEWRNE